MKTVSTKLSKEDFEEFQENCNDNGQCMSERLRELIKMNTNSNSKPFENCTNCDEETHETLRKISNLLHESDSYSLDEDDNGRPLRFNVEWIYNN